ncbi:hypothetical protein JXA56_04745 [Candidatus Micrarchaeota archaeon]|nr:hypothetical protein [Candidatus Micrarchaeota archaeon]
MRGLFRGDTLLEVARSTFTTGNLDSGVYEKSAGKLNSEKIFRLLSEGVVSDAQYPVVKKAAEKFSADECTSILMSGFVTCPKAQLELVKRIFLIYSGKSSLSGGLQAYDILDSNTLKSDEAKDILASIIATVAMADEAYDLLKRKIVTSDAGQNFLAYTLPENDIRAYELLEAGCIVSEKAANNLAGKVAKWDPGYAYNLLSVPGLIPFRDTWEILANKVLKEGSMMQKSEILQYYTPVSKTTVRYNGK